MNPIKYKLDLLDKAAEQGDASRIVIRDAKTVLTIGNMHAPLITVLENGEVQIFKNDVLVSSAKYNEGFLTCSDNNCEIFLLK